VGDIPARRLPSVQNAGRIRGGESIMGIVEQVKGIAGVLPTARRNKVDLLRWLGRRPQLLAATGMYETALLLSGRMDIRLKSLAELKAAAMVTCEYCIDIGSALATRAGITPAQLRALPNYRDSDEFSADDKLVLELAEAMTSIPTTIDDDLRARLTRRFSKAEVTELMAATAWENYRGRLNQALGVRPSGFSDGAACAVPER
jgi:AhpD family alkylhydroperoxidase